MADRPFPKVFFERPAEEVAPELLGARLRSTVGGVVTEGVVVETEAYVGPHDPASHAAERIGRTARNEPMFGPGGTAYVYLIYGMHHCMNVVTGELDEPAAVLIRALEPTRGLDVMEARRDGNVELTSGPGRLSQALGLDRTLNRHALDSAPLELLQGRPVEAERIMAAPRVGIRVATDWPLRFCVSGSRWVSRPRPDGTG